MSKAESFIRVATVSEQALVLEFAHEGRAYLVKNFTDGDVYVGLKDGATKEESMLIPANTAQCVILRDKLYFDKDGKIVQTNSLKAPLERLELIGNSVQGENPAPDNPQEIKSAGRKSKNLLIENISVFTVQDNIAYIPLPEGHETKLYTMLIQKKPGENDDVGFTCGFYDKSNMTATYSAPCLQAGNLVTGNGIVNSKIGVNHFVCFSPADSRFFDIYNVMYAEGMVIPFYGNKP